MTWLGDAVMEGGMDNCKNTNAYDVLVAVAQAAVRIEMDRHHHRPKPIVIVVRLYPPERIPK